MTNNISTNSNEQLKLKIKKAIEARKIVRKKINGLFSQVWKLKNGKSRLDWLIHESKEELGRRKGRKCKALALIKPSWGGSFTCNARELSFNSFSSKEDIYRKHCCTCRWKPTQAQTRMIILRIKNGRKGDEEE